MLDLDTAKKQTSVCVRRFVAFNNGQLTRKTNTVDPGHPVMEGSNTTKTPGFGHHKKESSVCCSGEAVTHPRKLNGSSVETPSHQDLLRELLLSHKRGLLLEEKPELKRVLEQRRMELHREEELAQRRPSDLETELRKRQQKLQEYEQEEIRRREDQQKIPEFVRVRDNLRRTQASEQ